MDDSTVIHLPKRHVHADHDVTARAPEGEVLSWGESTAKKRRAPARGIPGVTPKLEYAICREVMKRRWLHNVMTFLMMPLTWKLGIRINYQPDDFYAEVQH